MLWECFHINKNVYRFKTSRLGLTEAVLNLQTGQRSGETLNWFSTLQLLNIENLTFFKCPYSALLCGC